MQRSEKISCFLEAAKYASFSMLGSLGLSCYILADTYFISKGLGADGLAALNLAIPIYSFIHGCGLMIGMGGGTKYSLHKSAGSRKETDRIFTSAVLLSLAAAVLFAGAGMFFSGSIASLLGADARVYDMTEIYLRVILLFSPLFLMNNVMLCFVRNDGAPQLSMRAMLGGSLSNILLDYVLIFPLHMGIFGAVLATGLAPAVSLLLLSPHFLKKKHGFHLAAKSLSGGQICGILSCGIPSLVTELSSGIVIIIFNMIILNLQGNVGVAAYGVIANLSLVVLSIYTGMAQGIQPVLSRHYGAGRRGHALAVLSHAAAAVLLLSALLYASVFFGAEQISSIFNKDRNPMLQETASAGLRMYFTACPFAGLNIVISTFFTSCAHPLPANMISMLRGFILIIPLAFLFAAAFQMTGVWCAFPCTELLVSVLALILFVRFYRASGTA